MMPARAQLKQMERFKSACTDWTSYIEINRPNCLILGRFAEKQGTNRFGQLILISQQLTGLAEVFPFIAVENEAHDMTRVVDAYFRKHREIEVVALCIGPVHLIQPLSNLHDAKDVA
jgi:hypothetical protein